MKFALPCGMKSFKPGLNPIPLVISLSLITACGGKAPPMNVLEAEVRPGQQKPSEVSLPAGPLENSLNEFYKSPYLESCDRADEKIRRILVSALDDETRKQSGSQDTPVEPPSGDPALPSGAKKIPFQGSYLIDAPKRPATKGWTTGSDSWGGIHSYYEKNRASPPPGFWSRINRSVRSIMVDDKRRVINGTNYAIDHENIKHLEPIRSVLATCLEDSKCLEPKFEGALALAVRSIPMYRTMDQFIRSREESEHRKKYMGGFLKRVNRDLLDHQGILHPELKIRKTGLVTEFNLAMDPGSLTEQDREVVKSAIESVWKRTDESGEKLFKIDWNLKSAIPSLHQILFHLDRPGERAFVDVTNKTMNLFPGSSTRTIAHEFGHVIGFDDHYYTIWNPDYCEYTTEFSDEDLMSNTQSGDVTDEEWDMLLKSAAKP